MSGQPTDAQSSRPREFVLIQRSEQKPKSLLDNTEQVAKLLSVIAIPVLVAWFGARIQSAIGKETVAQQYVAMACSVLRDKEADNDLRAWAVNVIRNYSSVPLAEGVANKLQSGEIILGGQTETVVPGGGWPFQFERPQHGGAVPSKEGNRSRGEP